MKLLPSHLRADRAPEPSRSNAGSDGAGRGMDVAITLALFIGVGWLVDRWLGTTPVVTVVLIVLSSIGQFVRMKYVYDAEMERLEAERRLGRPAPARAEDAA